MNTTFRKLPQFLLYQVTGCHYTQKYILNVDNNDGSPTEMNPG